MAANLEARHEQNVIQVTKFGIRPSAAWASLTQALEFTTSK